MRVQRSICSKFQRGFLRRWWAAVCCGFFMIIFAAILAVIFPRLTKYFINKEITLREGGQTFRWWKNPPVDPQMRVYIYNVTNADDFLNSGKKPILQELGPYVYIQTWEKVNVKFNPNGTVTYNVRKKFIYSENLSRRSEEDLIIVPNVPMLSATTQSKNAARFLRLAMASIMDILKIKPFVEVSVGQFLWGYEDPLLKLAKDVVPTDQKLPYEQFGLFYEKNGTSKDNYTIFTGSMDIKKYGLLDNWNGKHSFGHWTTSDCDSVMGTDGSIFPPHITKDTILKIFDKDLCRVLPLVYKHDVVTAAGVPGFRFVPSTDVFSSSERIPSQRCFCPSGPPCAPEGTFNVSLCQYDSPILLSFPHFYLADPSLREAVVGISSPDPEKHQLFIDVQPMMGNALRARARIQINLAVSQVRDIKQVANFPDIVFPLIWFEDGIDQLPEEITSLLKMAVELPPIARILITSTMAVIGFFIFTSALICLARAANRQEKLRLTNPLAINVTKANTNSSSNIQNLSSK